MAKNTCFLALAALFLRLRQNKKNWNSNLDHLEQLLLKRFCSTMKLIFSLFIVNAVLDKCFAGGSNIIFKSSYLGNLIFYPIPPDRGGNSFDFRKTAHPDPLY